MNSTIIPLLALAGALNAPGAIAQATFYEREAFNGTSLTASQRVPNFQRFGFNDQASSVVVTGGRWEVCQDAQYSGRCMVLRPGRYDSLGAMGLDNRVSSARMIGDDVRVAENRYAPLPGPPPREASVTFYDREGFAGRSITATQPVINLRRELNARASSAVVVGQGWVVCEDNRYQGQCSVLRPGRYASPASMGLTKRVSSVRRMDQEEREQNRESALDNTAPQRIYDSRRRGGERLYDAYVTSSRAVLATSGQRCWIEQERVPSAMGGANMPAAIAGALIGGILGHQVGNGTGQDIATVGGAVAGAALGSQVGRGDRETTQDVQRCENIPGGAQAAYWDVSYNFRGRDHRVQMTTAPGQTITVNEQGEPRDRE